MYLFILLFTLLASAAQAQQGSQPIQGAIPNLIGNGSTDNCAALTSYISGNVVNNRIVLNFPAGIFVSSCALVFANTSVSIKGDSTGTTELRFTGSTNGLQFTTQVTDSVNISDITINTTQVNTNSAVKITYTVVGFSNRENTKLNISNVQIKGVDIKTQSWNKCLDLTDVHNVKIYGLDCLGIMGSSGTAGQDEAPNTTTDYGIYLAGTNYPTDYKISSSYFYSLNYAFYAVNTATEGLTFTANTWVNVGYGVYWVVSPALQGRPMLMFVGNHINSYTSCITLTGVAESVISDNLFYHSPGATSAQISVNLTNTNAVSVANNQFENFGTAATTGIAINHNGSYSTAPYLNKITGNLFGSESANFTKGISINAGAQALVSGNRYGQNVATKITDTSGAAAGQQTAYGRHYISLKRGGTAQSIPNTTATLVSWDAADYQTAGWNFTAPMTGVYIPATQTALAVKCTASIQFDANSTGIRSVQILRNGVQFPGLPIDRRSATPAPYTTDITLATGIIPVSGSDILSIQVSQTSGGALNLIPQYTWFACEMME